MQMYITQKPSVKLSKIFQSDNSQFLSKAPWTVRSNDQTLFFSRGKWALEKLFSGFLESQGKTQGIIYIPEYFCEISLTPLRMAGHTLHFYKITSELEPDIDHVNTIVQKHGLPDALLFVHYFGFPIKINEAKAWCKINGILLIEDAAHTLIPIPGIGDNGFPIFYTPWKFLGIPEGALLILPSQFISNVKQFFPKSDNFIHVLKMMGRFGIDYIGLRFKIPIHKMKKQRVKEPHENEPWQDPKSPACSKLSLKILFLSEECIDEIRYRRERNYRRLDRIISNSRIGDYRVFKQLPTFFAPYVYPLRVPEYLCRKAMVALNKKGIPAAPWSDLSPDVKNSTEFPMANILRREIMTLPVHQDITLKHINRIGAETVSILEV